MNIYIYWSWINECQNQVNKEEKKEGKNYSFINAMNV